jgi:hypothetical protein
MTTAVCYVYPQIDSRRYFPLAKRFAGTWRQFPGHSLHLLCNGSAPHPSDLVPFQGIPYEAHTCSNLGWDCVAFQWAAESIPCDLLVCLGAPVHFYHPLWLDRMVEEYLNHGPALYGCSAYLSPNWHVRTTAFWCPPILIQSYPYQITSSRASRYDFEHGAHSLTRHAMAAGFETLMVTWRGVFPFSSWQNNAPTRDEILVRDQHIF